MSRASMRELLAKDLTIIEIDPDDEWGMDRNEGLGGSEAGSAMGLNKYHGVLDLLEEKVKRISLREFSEAQELRMACGHAQEALTLKTFAAKELKIPYTTSFDDLDKTDGLGHLSKHLFVNPRFPFAFAHVDGLYRLNDELGVVDAKVTFRSAWPEVPEYYVAQLAHYNAVLGSNVGYISAMFQDHPYPVPRDYRFDFTPEQLGLVMRAEALFWSYVVKMRAGERPGRAELLWLEATLTQIGEDFMSGLQKPAKETQGTETVVVDSGDMALLVRYAALKEEAKNLYAEIDAIGEYLKKSSESENVSFVSEGGTVLAKKATMDMKSLDREAMVEAGIAVEAFYTAKTQTRLTMTKALSKLLAEASLDQTANGLTPNGLTPNGPAHDDLIPAGLLEMFPSPDDLADQDLPLHKINPSPSRPSWTVCPQNASV